MKEQNPDNNDYDGYDRAGWSPLGWTLIIMTIAAIGAVIWRYLI